GTRPPRQGRPNKENSCCRAIRGHPERSEAGPKDPRHWSAGVDRARRVLDCAWNGRKCQISIKKFERSKALYVKLDRLRRFGRRHVFVFVVSPACAARILFLPGFSLPNW